MAWTVLPSPISSPRIDPPLHQREPGAERLVAAQPQAVAEPGGVQPLRVDPLDDVGRQVALGRGDVAAEADDLTEQAVVVGRALLEVAPDLARRWASGPRGRPARPAAGRWTRPCPTSARIRRAASSASRLLCPARMNSRRSRPAAAGSATGRCGGELLGELGRRRPRGLAGVPHRAPDRPAPAAAGSCPAFVGSNSIRNCSESRAACSQLLGGGDRLARRCPRRCRVRRPAGPARPAARRRP